MKQAAVRLLSVAARRGRLRGTAPAGAGGGAVSARDGVISLHLCVCVFVHVPATHRVPKYCRERTFSLVLRALKGEDLVLQVRVRVRPLAHTFHRMMKEELFQ